ncbi:MAG: transposase [Chloroflexota bacterium]|nr:transposase [Chloroflexota bacterium]
MREFHRRSLRLRSYDYSQAGAYFITICVQHRICLLGTIEDEVIHLNAAGQAIQSGWERLPSKFSPVSCDAMVVMPNHIHGILLLSHESQDPGSLDNPVTLGDAMQWFKTMTTNEYMQGVKNQGWAPFPGRLWQRNYYEHIIRNDNDLDRIRAYIDANPSRWATDAENPECLLP